MQQIYRDCLIEYIQKGELSKVIDKWKQKNNHYFVHLKQSAQKIMYNGQLLILRDGKTYNIMGVEITK
jgi:hypothetical protein